MCLSKCLSTCRERDAILCPLFSLACSSLRAMKSHLRSTLITISMPLVACTTAVLRLALNLSQSFHILCVSGWNQFFLFYLCLKSRFIKNLGNSRANFSSLHQMSLCNSTCKTWRIKNVSHKYPNVLAKTWNIHHLQVRIKTLTINS